MTPKQLFFYGLEVSGFAIALTAWIQIPWWVGLIVGVAGYTYRIIDMRRQRS